MSQLQNVGSTFVKLVDGNLGLGLSAVGPTALVLGTSRKGPGDELVITDSPGDVISVFGRYGDLAKGWVEVKEGGIPRAVCFRVGATAAKLRTLMASSTASGGLEILTSEKGAEAGLNLKVYYSSNSGSLKLFNDDNELIFHSSEGETLTNTYEASVTGSPTSAAYRRNISVGVSDAASVGTYLDAIPLKWIPGETALVQNATTSLYGNTIFSGSVGWTTSLEVGEFIRIPSALGYTVAKVTGISGGTVTVAQADGSTAIFSSASTIVTVTSGFSPAAVYTDGLDNDNPSLMQRYEFLDTAYEILDDAQIDVVVPMSVHLDDANLVDGGATITITAPQTYPIPRSSSDALGKLFKELYNGKLYYFWDTDNDGVAELYPSAEALGIYDPTQAAAWVTAGGRNTIADFIANTYSYDAAHQFVASDFHEVNFGYQLANYCKNLTLNDNEASGVIGMKPPTNYDLATLSAWVGSKPVLAGDGSVTTSGSGLLGNKWMSGIKESTAQGWAGPGFFATDTGWVDGTIELDRNDQQVDIGAYIDVTAQPIHWSNTFNTSGVGYIASGSTLYGGFYKTLPVGSAPTNKNLGSRARLPFKLNKSTQLDALAGARYVVFNLRANGSIYIEDAPTASRPTSDYNRRSTVETVFACTAAARSVANRYRGEGSNGRKMLAMENDILSELQRYIEQGAITRAAVKVRQTPQQRVQGNADIEMTLYVSYELRRITIYLSLGVE